MVDDTDRTHLRRCVELARAALDAGDEPFGSVLVDADGRVRFEDSNHVAGGDGTQHPEFAIARWAAQHLTPQERAAATVYTSGEHCPMCAAAHAWVGLGRIVYASSSVQLAGWLAELGIARRRSAPCRSTRWLRTYRSTGRCRVWTRRCTSCTGGGSASGRRPPAGRQPARRAR